MTSRYQHTPWKHSDPTTSPEHERLFGLWSWDLQDAVLLFSRTVAHMHGCDDSEGTNAHPMFCERIHELIADQLARRQPHVRCDYQIVQRGSIRWIYLQAAVQYDINGVPIALAGSCIDVTSEKQRQRQVFQLAWETILPGHGPGT